MGFCGSCGFELSDDVAFCPKCGASTAMPYGEERSAERESRKGDVGKCPQCGEILPPFSTSCPSCGMRLRARASTSVAELSQRLDEIEATRPKHKKKKRFGKGDDDSRIEVSPTDQRKVTLIQSFPIPNTKEDLVEFMVLASTNVNPKTFAETQHFSPSERAISAAWYSKLEQAYEKAEIVLSEDPCLASLRQRFEKTKKAVEKNGKKTDWKSFCIFCLGFILLFVGLYAAIGISNSSREAYLSSLSPEERIEYDIDQEEKSCKSDESSVRSYIKDGDYSAARNRIYAIDFDEGLSAERHEYWEKRKLELLQTVDDAESASTKTRVGE